MSNKKAQAAKDQGNAAFKAGDYPTAIGHYTSAILADRTDATYPLNRAAAYLKLGKNEDAERDCSTTLGLSPLNVKALFRRGLARMALGKYADARGDLVDVLRLEPTNVSVQAELKNLASLLEKETSKYKKIKETLAPGPASAENHQPKDKSVVSEPTRQESVQASKSPNPLVKPSFGEGYAHKRRRVPIEIIDPNNELSQLKTVPAVDSTPPAGLVKSSIPYKSPVATPQPSSEVTTPITASEPGFLNPISSRSLKSSPPVIESLGTPPPLSTTPPKASTNTPTKSRSFQDAKQARETTKPSRVGGGIFRASGASTVFPTRGASPASQPGSLSSANPGQDVSPDYPLTFTETVLLHELRDKPPGTLFEFTKAWGSMSSVEARWQLINTVSPTNFPALCKTSFEASLLSSILEAIHGKLSASANDPSARKVAAEYLENFRHIPRFGTIILFLNKSEKGLAKRVWAALGVDKPTGVWSSVG